MANEPELKCSRCQQWRPASEFWPKRRAGRTRRVRYYCKDCDPRLRGHERRVDSGPLRARFVELKRLGLTSNYALAKSLGWYRRESPASTKGRREPKRVPDGGRVTRTLGLARSRSGGHWAYRRTMRAATARRFAALLDVPPRELGL